MEIIVAETAGLCFGVRLALERAVEEAKKGKVVTLGPIIHNKHAVRELENQGIFSVSCAELPDDATVIIRAHGIPPETYAKLNEKGIKYCDCTCPFVAKIQGKVKEEYEGGARIVILGDSAHPEIIGINGYAGNSAIILNSIEDTEEAFKNNAFSDENRYYIVVQTTFNTDLFEKMEKALNSGIKNAVINNTICSATRERQKESAELSRRVDCMVVIGDKQSSNSLKLYEICKKNQEKTYFIESIRDLVLNIFSIDDKIGITAGASTPPAIIKEAVLAMNEFDGKNENEAIVNGNTVNDTVVDEVAVKEAAEENADNKPADNANEGNEGNTQTFEEMLALDGSLVTLHTGGVVTGTVISVVNGEVNVNLGFKSDGIIQKGEFSEDSTIDPADVLKPGDQIEVFVVRVNDKEGNVLLSRKRLEMQKGLVDIEEAAESGAVLPGRITEVVKGGVIAVIKGARAFVPSSQVSNRYVEIDKMDTLVGKEFNFQILQYDKSKRRIVAGRKLLAAKEVAQKKEELFSSIEPGAKYEGTVSRIVDFGAFVDIGGIDGLIHISQLSWGRVKKVSSVLKEGDKVVVTVIGVDKEKEKISLTLKDIAGDPWNNVEEKYPVGAIVTGKVVRMVSFGAFVELEPGLDGLVHISQIADKHVVKPDDILTIGETIEVKITDINAENKKISLSKKAADGIKAEEESDVVNEVVEEAVEEVAEEVAEETAEAADTGAVE